MLANGDGATAPVRRLVIDRPAKDREMLLEDPICEICREPIEPIPPVGWICLNEPHFSGTAFRALRNPAKSS